MIGFGFHESQSGFCLRGIIYPKWKLPSLAKGQKEQENRHQALSYNMVLVIISSLSYNIVFISSLSYNIVLVIVSWTAL